MRLSTLAENEIIITLIAPLLLLSAYLFGTLFEKIRGPRVVGEIIGGMLFGGSFYTFSFLILSTQSLMGTMVKEKF